MNQGVKLVSRGYWTVLNLVSDVSLVYVWKLIVIGKVRALINLYLECISGLLGIARNICSFVKVNLKKNIKLNYSHVE